MSFLHQNDCDFIVINGKKYPLEIVRLIHPDYSLPENASVRFYDPNKNHFLIFNNTFQVHQPNEWLEGDFLMSRTQDMDRLMRLDKEDIEFLKEQQKLNLHKNKGVVNVIDK